MILAASVHLICAHKSGLERTLLAAEDALRFVRFAHDAIRLRSLPVSRILTEYASESPEFDVFYLHAAKTSLAQALDTSTEFDEKTRAILAGFARELGRGLTDAELLLCEDTAARLAAHCRTIEDASRQKSSVFGAAVAFISASLILLLF